MARVQHRHGPSSPCRPDQHRDAPPKNGRLNDTNDNFDSNCLYVIKCLALVFVAAPCVLFAGGMLICLLMWCGLHITRAMHLRRLGLPRCGRCRYWATVQCPLYGRNTPSDFCSRGEKRGEKRGD